MQLLNYKSKEKQDKIEEDKKSVKRKTSNRQRTPEEAWSKIKPNVSHFLLFGCEAWADIPDEKWKALQPKSEKCIFVGYYEDVKGYSIIQPHPMI